MDGMIDERIRRSSTTSLAVPIFFMMMIFKGMRVWQGRRRTTLCRNPGHEIASRSGEDERVRESGTEPVAILMITGFVVLGLIFYDRLDLISAADWISSRSCLRPSTSSYRRVGRDSAGRFGRGFCPRPSRILNAAQAMWSMTFSEIHHPKASNRRTLSSTTRAVWWWSSSA